MTLIDSLGVNERSIRFLLSEFGKWAYFCGCAGYPKGHTETKSTTMDDESGALIDRALGFLKGRNYNLYKLLKLHYVRGLSLHQIRQILKDEKQRKEQFNLGLENKEIRYITLEAIDGLIVRGEKQIIEIILQIKSLQKRKK